MNFEDEAYRRFYTRRTFTNKFLGWEGRAVMHEMLYEFDRSGVFEFKGDIVRSIAIVTGLPEDVVRVGLERLTSTETWTVRGTAIVWPTFVHAQNCKRSDRLRQQQSREARRDDALDSSPEHEPPSRPVTGCHDSSQASQIVTLSSAQSQPNLSSAQPKEDTSPPAPADVPKPVIVVFDYWKLKLGHERSSLDRKREKLIRESLKRYSVDDLKRAIDGCAKSDFHMGRDPKSAGKRYDGIGLIFRDAEHIEQFLKLNENGGIPPPRRNGHQSTRDEAMSWLAEQHAEAKAREAM